jgi:hypothetical protein
MGNCISDEKCSNNELNLKTQNQLTAHHASTYLVSCMDFRLLDDIVRAMDKMGYNNNYDQFIVAGASLGFCQSKYPHWRQTVYDHLEIGLNLHKFRQFIFIDHLDCGAYKKFFPEIKTVDDEKRCHKEQLQIAHDLLKEKFPDFNFEAYIMNLHGDLEEVPIDKTHKIELKTDNGDNFLSSIQENTIVRNKTMLHSKSTGINND